MGAGKSNIPPSQISHKKAAISRANWLKDECDFRNIDSSEVEACCYYEFFRESAVMRGTIEDGHWRGGVLPTCADQTGRSTLTFALNKAGWEKAAKKNQAPPLWNSLTEQVKSEIGRCVERCGELKADAQMLPSQPPLLVEEFLPGHDPVELESQLEKWREKSCDAALVDRTYFFGLFRLDGTCNEKEAVEAFRAFFRKQYGETQGSKSGRGARWRERLNQLAVMRIRKHARNQWERLELVAKFCGYHGCVEEAKAYRERCEYGGGHEPMGAAAKVEISSARADALKFFQSLFPAEEPLNY